MKLSLNWLNEFLNLDEVTPEEVAKKLTLGSFEVEEIHKVGPKLKGPILVGQILSIQKHLNADRLSVTKVTTDGKNELQIVCGAQNIKEGQKVAVSLEGAVVINRTDGSEFPIKTSKIRGIESFGMLCSPSELGVIGADPNGILTLSEDSKIGGSVIDLLSLKQDIVLEVGSRSNRGDALSVYGLSKEISAVTGKKLKSVEFKTPIYSDSVKNIIPKIENPADSRIFYTVTIENIKIKESPPWLKNLLGSVGLRSINNIVDITNYINITFGQPMHAYDREKLRGTTLVVRRAKSGEKIITLDGKTKELKENVLVIADEKGPVAVAGIMGGKDSEVSENTTSIVLEAAVFSPPIVRRGSRAIGLFSEASKRFERGVDSNFTYNALLRAVELVKECSGSKDKSINVGKILVAGAPDNREVKIKLESKEIKRVLGIELNTDKVCKLLELLEFKTKKTTNGTFEVLVPKSRINDISRPIDLIEEIARIYGYDKIPTIAPCITISPERGSTGTESIKNHFLSCGFSEVFLSSLVGEHFLSLKDFPVNTKSLVTMLNPLSKEHSTLRQSLIPGLLEALRWNQSHQIVPIKIFEIGKAYSSTNAGKGSEKETAVTEELKTAGILYGRNESWLTNNRNISITDELFFQAKGFLENLFEKNRCQVVFSAHKENYLHPSYTLKMTFNEKSTGILGCLHPLTEKTLGIEGPVIIFELSSDPLIKAATKGTAFERISSQPAVTRDITIDISKKYGAGEVFREIHSVKSDFVRSINLISVYELDKQNRSLTYRLKMQDLEETLTSEQTESEVNKVKIHLTSCFQAKFRV